MSDTPSKVSERVELVPSAQRSVDDIERIRSLSGGAMVTAERVARRKRKNRATVDSVARMQLAQGAPGNDD